MPSDPLNQPVRVARYRFINRVPRAYEPPHNTSSFVRPADVLAALTDEQVDALAARMADTIDQPYFLHLNGEYVPEDPAEVFAHAIHNACRVDRAA